MINEYITSQTENNTLKISVANRPDWYAVAGLVAGFLAIAALVYVLLAHVFVTVMAVRGIIIIVACIGSFLLIKQLIWQIRGRITLSFESGTCTLKKEAPFVHVSTTYPLIGPSATIFDLVHDSTELNKAYLNILYVSNQSSTSYFYNTLATLTELNAEESSNLRTLLQSKLSTSSKQHHIHFNSYGI